METGLEFAQARYFSSVQGRFTSVDPLLSSGKPLTPQSWNRYTYVLNNPLKYVDPNGLEWYTRQLKNGDLQPVWYDKHPGGSWKRWKGGDIFYSQKNKVWVTLNPWENQHAISSSKEGAKSAFEDFRQQAMVDWSAGYASGLGGSPVVSAAGSLVANTDSSMYQFGARMGTALSLVATAGEGTLLSGVKAGAGSLADEGMTTLYRAVSHAEFEQIMRTGTFQVGSNSLGGKFFAESAEHAAQWGQKLEGTQGFRVVDVRLPTVQADKLMRWERLDGIGPARYAELNQLSGTPIGTVK